MHRVDRRLDLVGPGLVQGQTLADQRVSLLDLVGVPGGAVLVGQVTRTPSRTRAGRRASSRSMSASSPSTSGCGPREALASRSCRVSRIASAQRSSRTDAACGQVALVEDQVEHGEHPAIRFGRSSPMGTRYGIRACLIFAFARVIRWAIVVSGTRNAWRDLGDREAAEQP